MFCISIYFALRVFERSWREQIIRENFDSAGGNFGQFSRSQQLVPHLPVFDNHDGDDDGEDEGDGDADDGHDAAQAEHVTLVILLILEESSLDISSHCCGVKHASGNAYDWSVGVT